MSAKGRFGTLCISWTEGNLFGWSVLVHQLWTSWCHSNQVHHPCPFSTTEAARVSVKSSTHAHICTHARAHTGEYNCFLNVIIQCLWHLSFFKGRVAAMVPRHTQYRQQVRAVGLELPARLPASAWTDRGKGHGLCTSP